MPKKPPGGMLMSPSNGGSGSGGGRKRTPTGEAVPIVSEGEEERDPKECRIEPEKPMEVVFTQQTFRRLIAWTLGPLMVMLVGAISAFFFFYHKTNVHISDPAIHLTRGERGKLETKAEANTERTKLKGEIINHFDVKIREVKVEQRENVIKLGRSLKSEQRRQIDKILKEVKKAHNH